MALAVEWSYFARVNVYGLKTPAERAARVVKSLPWATEKLGGRPDKVVVDHVLLVDLEVLDGAGLRVVRVNRPRSDKETVDLTRDRNGNGGGGSAPAAVQATLI